MKKQVVLFDGMLRRVAALDVIYRYTHRDYKGKTNGVRSLLVLRAGGTTLVPLDQLTDDEIRSKLPAALRAEQKAKLEISDAELAEVKRGLWSTWGDLASDFCATYEESRGRPTNVAAVETCLDAGRMAFVNKEADAIVRRIANAGQFGALVRKLARTERLL